MQLNRVHYLFLILLLILAILVIRSGGLWEMLAYDCRLAAEAMQRPWQWVSGACYIQQVDGNWTRIDTTQIRYQP